jgi:hypothetical protein
MLVLALRSDAARVYEHALEYFTPDEIAEAFAAARGVASPTQLRVVMKRDGRDLLRQFRELAPPSRPISLQRWNIKRLTLTSTVLGCAALALVVLASVLVPAYDHELGAKPDCGTNNVMVLMAQAVPAATVVPCLAELPDGWAVGGMRVERGKGTFWLNSDRAGTHAVEATLLPRDHCVPGDVTEVRSELAGARRFETTEPDAATPVFTRWYVFGGGCVRYRVDLGGPSAVSLRFDANDALGFQPRSALVAHVHERTGLRLCGAGAACVGGT